MRRRRKMRLSTTPSTLRKPTNKTSAACRPQARPVSEEAIPAATLILVREPIRGAPELLMVERAGGMAFAAGALVFPGGRIDAADRELAEKLGSDAAAVAAIRETVEETAVPAGLRPVPDAKGARQLQDALVADRSLAELLCEFGL